MDRQVLDRLISCEHVMAGERDLPLVPANISDVFRLAGASGTPPSEVHVRNVWERRDLGLYHGRFSSLSVASHETQLYPNPNP